MIFEAVTIGYFTLVKADCMNVFVNVWFCIYASLMAFSKCHVLPASTYLSSVLSLPFSLFHFVLSLSSNTARVRMSLIWISAACLQSWKSLYVSYLPSLSNLQRSYMLYTSWCRSDKVMGALSNHKKMVLML